MTSSVRTTVRALLQTAVDQMKREGLLPAVPGSISVERPKRPEHGDYATNTALELAKAAGKQPRALAEIVVQRLRATGGAELSEVSVAGPGFINLRLSDVFWQRRLLDILGAQGHWGQGEAKPSPRVLVEYLSANPTGPLHFAHGRHAAVGDSLTRLLRFAGYDVLREFYLNDSGNQVAMLGLSVWARYMEAAKGEDWTGVIVPEVAFPENGYRGDYIRDLGRELLEREAGRFVGADPPADMEPIKQFAIARCLDMIRGTLAKFDVTFDVWQSERALHDSGEVSSTLAALEQAGFIDRRDGAVWLKTTVLWGDDKDRVVLKSDGVPTYLLADIAYHRKKIERGFDELCDIWGADHHGHVPRMQAALKALGHDPNRLSVLLIQMVSLLRDGKPVAMGKREGEFVTLDEVIDEIGRDATRFFYLMRRHDTPLEFDLELAKRQSMDNPVYYAQYAHARCASLLRRATELEAPRMAATAELFARLNLPEEIALLRRLSDFPDFVEDAAAAREPHRLVSFIGDLAGEFQSYYTRLQKVHGDSVLPQERQRVGNWRATWDWQKTAARLHWVEAIRQVLETALGLVGVSAPAVMKRIGEEGEEAS
ncbi:MAG TPA: arginine--tRNA ligase [Polyangia bacterium]|jgi:arginyl-tRNA synthetase|nr:arginine--tRNA ligase [Polyangia bacterium]